MIFVRFAPFDKLSYDMTQLDNYDNHCSNEYHRRIWTRSQPHCHEGLSILIACTHLGGRGEGVKSPIHSIAYYMQKG